MLKFAAVGGVLVVAALAFKVPPGLVIGAGEVFGGGAAPSIAGAIAQNYGLQYILYFAMAGQLVGIVVALFFRETAPSKA